MTGTPAASCCGGCSRILRRRLRSIPTTPVALGVALSYQGLKALGVPEASLASFAPEFQQGMAARAAHLGDVGESAPEHWEQPLGSPDVHLVVVGLARSDDHLKAALDHARDALRDLSGVVPIWQQDVHVPADLRNALGFADGISHPAVAGSGIPGTNPHEEPLKAGEFVLGYEDETYTVAPVPQPEVLGRNGTYVVFRKLHTRTAAWRQYLHQNAKDPGEEEWLGAKIVGRWPSGAPLSLSPDKDDPELGADPNRNNAFMFGDDPQGLKCPVGSHVRRMNPRDAVVIGQPRIHRMIRRGTTYGPPLPPGVHGGRRRRPRPDVRLRRGAPRPAVRVRPDGVGQRRQVHRRPGREGPAGGRERRRGVHHPPAADPPPPAKGCPPSSSTAAASTASCPACEALRWLAELDT